MKIILVLFIFTKLIYCNIWDNIFSQVSSPQFSIADESKVEVLNKDSKLIMEILLSSKRNVMKIKLIDEKIAKMLANSTTVVDIYVNFTNGTINLDFSDNCVYQNVTFLNTLSLKFFLASYDILTFFNNSDNYYEYIFTNPLQGNAAGKIRYQLMSLRNLKGLEFLSEDSSSVEKIKNINKLFEIKEIFDSDSYIRFDVNKITNNLEKIGFKYNGYEFPELNSISKAVDKFDDSEFELKHKCALFNTKNNIEWLLE